jgi:meso-butanediol dehydrogenase / (S,S)-butanediol dehydrogenase / diacetyl reductase
MYKRFDGKVVIITGAAGGLGLATALRLAQEGAKLAAVDRDEAALRQAMHQFEAEGADALAIVADVSKVDDSKMIVDKTIEKFGRFDCYFVNAGTQPGRRDRL